MMQLDFKRYINKEDNTNFYIKLFTVPGLRFMYFFRVCNKYKARHPLGLIARFCFKRMQVKYGYQIPHTCKIGKGLFLGHFGNIVINQNSVIGENCNIAQGVTIGHVSRGKRKGSPLIGDRVWIGANAVIVGNVIIGDNVLIAPLTFVNFDIPDNAVVIGNPGKIVNYNGSNGYVNNLA